MSKRSTLRTVVTLLAVAVALAANPAPSPAATARVAGFVVERIVTGAGTITALAFAPDGTLFFTEKNGAIKVVPFGAGAARIFVNVSVYTTSECGLLGLALDPAYSAYGQGGYVYVFATVANNEQRIIRFTDTGGQGMARTEIKRSLPTLGANHDGGCLKIGPDGKFYLAIGDGGSGASKSQDVTNLFGAVLRLNLDGTNPADNPDLSAVNQNYRREIFAYGFRNPFRIALRRTGPGAGDFQVWVNDVGSSGGGRREEVNLVTSGSNYGWPNVEGIASTPNPAYVNPIHAYSNEGNCIAGGTFYQGDLFPAEYKGNYFYTDYGSNKVFRMILDGDVKTSNAIFVDAENGLVDMVEGQDGAIYYSAGSGIFRIRYEVPGNVKPVAALVADQVAGSAPLAVAFDASGSTDADGTVVRHDWSFGDTTSDLDAGPQVTHTYAADGTYVAQVLVRDDKGGSASKQVTITVSTTNNAPEVEILAPAMGTTHDAGVTVDISGRASDPEDGDLTGDQLRWDVILHHDAHTHPFLSDARGATSSFTIPSAGIEENWSFHITLTATDSKGKSSTVERVVGLNYYPLTLASDPPGMRLTADGVSFTTPDDYQAVRGARVEIGAPSPQDLPGTPPGSSPQVFDSWSDAGAATHEVVMAPGLSLTAVFKPDARTVFLRGDSNDDGQHDISDASYSLNYLFLGGPVPACLDAADANDDGSLDLSDPVAGLNVLFLGSKPLPSPAAAPGFDPTADGLGCRA